MTDLEIREAFETWYIANHHDGDIHPNQQLLEWSEKGGFYFASSVEDLWEAWQARVPEGYKLVPGEINDEIESAMFSSVARGEMPCDIYKSMIEAAVENQP